MNYLDALDQDLTAGIKRVLTGQWKVIGVSVRIIGDGGAAHQVHELEAPGVPGDGEVVDDILLVTAKLLVVMAAPGDDGGYGCDSPELAPMADGFPCR